MTDVRFLALNAASGAQELETLRETTEELEVLQETAGDHAFETLGADTEHILVIDRCNRLSYQVIMPWSILNYPYVKAAILSTYNDNPCGKCTAEGEEVNLNTTERNNVTLQTTDMEKEPTLPPLSWNVNLSDHMVINKDNNYGLNVKVETEVPSTTVEPRVTSSVPEEISFVPNETISVSKEISSVPNETISVSKEISSVPNETISVSKEISSIPEETSSKPESMSSVPEETSTVPEEISSVPDETSSVLEGTNSVPKEMSFVPEETSSVPEETRTVPGEMSWTVEELDTAENRVTTKFKHRKKHGHESPAIDEILDVEMNAERPSSWFGKTAKKYKKKKPGPVSNDPVPLKIIMRAPHVHENTKHEYLVLEVDDPEYHGHVQEFGEVRMDREGVELSGEIRYRVDSEEVKQEIPKESQELIGYVSVVQPDVNSQIMSQNMETVQRGEEGEELAIHYSKLLKWVNYAV